MSSGDAMTATYDHRGRGIYPQLILPLLRSYPEAVVAQASGLPRRTINWLRGGRTPHPPLGAALCSASQSSIAGVHGPPPNSDRGDLTLLAA